MAITKKKEQDGQQNAIHANMQYTAKREAGTPGPGRAPNGQLSQTATAYRNIAQAGTPGPRANMQQLQTVKPSAPQAGNPQTASQPVSQVQQGGYTVPVYQKSEAVQQAEQLLQQQMNNKPGAYQSKWQGQMDAMMDKILNQEGFEYDLNGDMLYQQLKDSAMLQGQKAMMDTMGQAATMTGGYANSYAQLAGQQAYQGQMQQLNDKVPELYQLALDKYNQDRQNLYNQYGMFADRETQDYGRYRDRVGDYYTELDRLTDAARYQSEQDYGRYTDQVNRDYGIHRDQVADQQWRESFDYGKSRDEVADQQWRESFEYGKTQDDIANQQWQQAFDEDRRQYDEQFAYQQGRDAVADQQWRESFDYGKSRDEVADQQWRESFDYGKSRDEVADQQWRESFEYGKSRDEVADRQWQQSFDYQQGRDQAEDAYRDKVFDYGVHRDQVADSQWDKNFAYQQDRDAAEDAYRDKVFDYEAGRDAVADQQWRESFEYGKTQDAIDNQYRDDTFAYQKEQDAIANQQWQQSFDYGKGRDAVADSQWQQEFNLANSGSGGSTQPTPTINFKSMGYNSYEQMATALKGLAWSSGNKALLYKLEEYIIAGYLDKKTAEEFYVKFGAKEEPQKPVNNPYSYRTQATK